MHFLFSTYRWGNDLVGGAEFHHRRLAEELLDAGHRVSVVTSTGHGLRGFAHWGTEWTPAKDLPPVDDRIAVHRVPLAARSRPEMAAWAKLLQFMWEREEAGIKPGVLEALLEHWQEKAGAFVLSGWHYAELEGTGVARWTHRVARLAARLPKGEAGQLVVEGYAPKPRRMEVRGNGEVLKKQDFAQGHVDLRVELPAGFDGIVELHLDDVFRPVQDFRGLGLRVTRLAVEPARLGTVEAALTEDYRSLGRADAETWQAYLLDRAMKRPGWCGLVFDRMRGPQARGWGGKIQQADADCVIHCNLPWGNVSHVRQGDLAMPLWHIEDEFYYWKHWIKALRRTRFVLSNTPHTAANFFPKLGINAHFVGPPIWEPELKPKAEEVQDFLRRHGILPNEMVVLTVCRKSPEKRYDAITASVARLRKRKVPIRMLGVGPDIDGRPVEAAGCQWLGKLLDDDLQRAYAACDVFCLMSESESFGMVIPEAWHHGKPVVVNTLCPTAASLLDDGVDGLLATPGPSLDAALERLALDPQGRFEMGESGRRKAKKHYTRGAAAERLLAALEAEGLLPGKTAAAAR